MKAINISRLDSSGHNPKKWEEIPEIIEARPNVGKNGFVEVSLQRLDTPESITLVQWHGAKNGFWYPASDIFLIKEK